MAVQEQKKEKSAAIITQQQQVQQYRKPVITSRITQQRIEKISNTQSAITVKAEERRIQDVVVY